MNGTVGFERALAIPAGADRSVRTSGLLDPFVDAGVLTSPDVQVASALLRIQDPQRRHLSPDDESVRLAAAFCVRALRHGSIAVDIDALADTDSTTEDGQPVAGLPWPDPGEWHRACASHPCVETTEGTGDQPLRLHDGRLYLHKYWDQESAILRQVIQRHGTPVTVAEPTFTRQVLRELFPGDAPDRQRLAAATAVAGHLTILAGGPGTGKTTTISRILSLFRTTQGADRLIALAAPTGKAAARMQDATNDMLDNLYGAGHPDNFSVSAYTLHRLLGWSGNPSRPFRHDRYNPLPHDIVVIDECSMVDVAMMHRLLEAVRPDARLILVGDPDQLASIDAGAVLGDLVAVSTPVRPDLAAVITGLAPQDRPTDVRGCGVVTLNRGFRFDGHIAQLAAAVSAGDPVATLDLLTGGHPDVEFIATQGVASPEAISGLRKDVTLAAADIQQAAARGDAVTALAALDRHRVLCAHREGPYGVARWNALIRSWTASGQIDIHDEWPVGRGIIITANDYSLGLFNGDAGVIVVGSDGSPRAAFSRPEGPLLIPPLRLEAVASLDAMTIHRGQGSQFGTVSVVLPDEHSPLLTKELLYTAITRAQDKVRLIGSPEAVVAAIGRPVVRASGLRERLADALGPDVG